MKSQIAGRVCRRSGNAAAPDDLLLQKMNQPAVKITDVCVRAFRSASAASLFPARDRRTEPVKNTK